MVPRTAKQFKKKLAQEMPDRTRLRLTWKEKAEIFRECERRREKREKMIILEICNWAQDTLLLRNPSSMETLRRLLCQSNLILEIDSSDASEQKNLYLSCTPLLSTSYVIGLLKCGRKVYTFRILLFKKKKNDSALT